MTRLEYAAWLRNLWGTPIVPPPAPRRDVIVDLTRPEVGYTRKPENKREAVQLAGLLYGGILR